MATGAYSTVENIDASQRMLFVGTETANKPIAYSTSATLNFSKDTVDTSNKADAGWKSTLGGKKSAELSVDSLCTKSGTGDEADLYTAFENDTNLKFIYAYVTITDADDGSTNITIDSTKPQYSGNLKISSINFTSDNGDVAKFAVSATSQGKVIRTAGSAGSGS